MDTANFIEAVFSDYNELEASLEEAVKNILNNRTDYAGFEQLYYTVYQIVVTNFGPALHRKLEALLADYLRQQVKVSLQQISNSSPFLETLINLWNHYRDAMWKMQHIFLYLDNALTTYSQFYSIEAVHMTVFKEQVLIHPKVAQKQNNDMLYLVEQDRKGENIDRKMLRDQCNMLMKADLGNRSLYRENFENSLVQTSCKKYYAETNVLLRDSEHLLRYVEVVHSILSNEAQRSELCFDPSTTLTLIEELEDSLIKKRLHVLVINSDCLMHRLLNQEDKTELVQQLCLLLQRIPEGMNPLIACVCKHVTDRSRSSVSELSEQCHVNSTTATYLLKKLKEMFEHADQTMKVIEETLADENSLRRSVEIEMKQILNDIPRISEFLAYYLHIILRNNTSKFVDDDETLDNVFNEWLVLFNYLDSKDLFELLYRQHLARRLLKSHSRNPQESDIVDKFRENCGYVYTSRMNGMLKDVEVFTDLNQEFESDIKPLHEDASKLETLVQVITPKYWPLPDVPVQCVLPVEAFQAFSLFSHYYLSQHERRQLTLLPQLGDAEVVMWVEDSLGQDRRYTLHVDTLQMTILVLFNHALSLTYEEIQQQTEIPDTELVYSLRALSSGKKDVLTRYPAADKENIGPGHTFVFNSNYRSRKSCVKLLPRFHRDQGAQTLQRKEEQFDRRSELEAAVMRVAKALGRVQELRLVLLVTDAVKHRFRPTPDDIKRVLPSLIERDFLKLSPENSKIYVYVP